MLGHPWGLPLKIAGGGKVVKNEHSESRFFFEAMLDTFSGNSGSPVLNEATLEVEGILVVGFGEYEDGVNPLTNEVCRLPRTLVKPEDWTGSWVTRATQFSHAVP